MERMEKKEQNPFDWKQEIMEWVKILLVAAAIAFVFNTFIVANNVVPSESMETTIMTGDRIIGSRLAYLFDKPQRGDIVIFTHKTGPGGADTRLVKRIIGMPGETVDIREGKVYIDGAEDPIEEPYLHEGMKSEDMHFVVAEGCYFMMGDNRNSSVDARNWSDHDVPEEKIIAKVLFRYFPRIGKIQ